MKNKIRIFIFLLFFCLVTGAESGSSTKSVSVVVELEEMPDVQSYEIEVKKTIDKKESKSKFLQDNPLFKIKLEVGNYQFRTRIVSVQSEMGPWSDWSELLARPDEVTDIEASANNFSVRKTQTSIEVDVQWQKANGAEKYIVWIEDQATKSVEKQRSDNTHIKLNLKLGEYKIGVQSVSRDGIKSDIKYSDDLISVAKTHLPKIQINQKDTGAISWVKLPESDVKIDIYRKAFFGDKYIKIQTLKESGLSWLLPRSLQPGEYRIDFQYISESFENGPIQTLNYLLKPTENDFTRSSK